MDERERLKQELTRAVAALGFPRELGELIGQELGTEKTLQRMLGYLRSVKPRTAQEMVDEMLAITADRDRWRAKKEAEFYNQKMNELIWYGLGVEEE